MKNELGELLEQLDKIESKISEWFDQNVKERLQNCKNADDVNKIVQEMCYICRNKNGESINMPSKIHVALCCKMSEFID